jgi:uncharacterized protein YbjT (DUF2867 family)
MILVTGGSGQVGSRVVQALLDSQQQVRVLTRGGGDWHENPLPHFRRSGAEIITGDVRDQSKVSTAVQGCRGIIHLAAVMKAPDKELEAVNVEGLINLVANAAAAGVQRFIHVSCLGATQFSTSKYFQTKWQGENMIRSSNFYWTIFRPSLIFSPSSQLMRTLDFVVSRTGFVPVFGSGLNEIQPVSADDVAACVVQSLYNRDSVNQTYDLVVPESYSLTDMLEMAARANTHTENVRPTFKIPLGVAFAAARILGQMNPRLPISEDMIRVLTTELVSDPAPMQSAFQVQSINFEAQFKRLAGR